MKIYFSFLCLIIHSAFLSASIFDTTETRKDSLFLVLDQVIRDKEVYAETKMKNIFTLSGKLHNALTLEDEFFIYGQLFEEYKDFQMDSALVIANKRAEIAREINLPQFTFFSDMDYVNVMIVTGMYKEALDLLDKQDRSKFISNDQFSNMYHLYHSLYLVMADYSFFDKEKEIYKEKEYQYKDSILSILDPSNLGYKLVEISKYQAEGNTKQVYYLSQEIYINNKDNYHFIGMLMYAMAEAYNSEGRTDMVEYFLTLSAINDLRSGVREYLSLPELAILVYNKGDVDRAYKYMKCSLEDAILCQARLRTLQMSDTLPIINTAYELKMKEEKQRLVIVIVVVIVLVITLIISFLYLYVKLKELARARKRLKLMNTELKSVNQNLKDLNEDLLESNYVKEEYIGYVFNLCSMYIDKIDNFRKKINRKIQGGQVDELYQQTSSSSFVNEEIKDFYKSFDEIFLNIYPTFISEFNNLLREEERIYPKANELLTPEMRIYALVRLGIDDSQRIAEFLHYSPQTIYNYRLKMRNKSYLSKEELYLAIKNIGIKK